MVGGKKEEVIQVKLRGPKTMRVMPHQVVALPTVKSSLCPVLAWKGYVKARGGRGGGGIQSLDGRMGEASTQGI